MPLVAALSGPISKGDQEANLQAFVLAQAVLVREGAWVVHTPLLFDKCKEAAAESRALIATGGDYRRGPLYREAVRWYLGCVLRADVLYTLPGWQRSHGARTEVFVAEQAGIRVCAWSEKGLRASFSTSMRLMDDEERDAVHSDGFRQGLPVEPVDLGDFRGY